MQLIGSSFILAGLVFIALHKARIGKSLIPSTFHSTTGFVSVLLIALQAVIGNMKLEQLRKNNTKIYRWHGDVGLLCWDLLCLTVVLGMISFYEISIVSTLSFLLTILTWIAVHMQLKKKPIIHPHEVADKEGGNTYSSEKDGSGNALLFCEDLDEGEEKGHVSII
jgi:hypothetical protein